MKAKTMWSAVAVMGIAGVVTAQDSRPSQTQSPAAASASQAESTGSGRVLIPAGTKLLLALKNGINTKTARPGDGVYLETAFPLMVDGRMLVPPGTYVQGTITSLKRPGKVKGRAELLMHFHTMILPNGYAIALPGALESAPGSDSHRIKDKEGTLQQEGQKGKDAGTVATSAGSGTLIGLGMGGAKGAGIGAAIGAGVGTAITLLTRGSDIRIDPGTPVEMTLQRPVELEEARLQGVPRQYVPVDRQQRVLVPGAGGPVNPGAADLNNPVLIPRIPR